MNGYNTLSVCYVMISAFLNPKGCKLIVRGNLIKGKKCVLVDMIYRSLITSQDNFTCIL